MHTKLCILAMFAFFYPGMSDCAHIYLACLSRLLMPWSSYPIFYYMRHTTHSSTQRDAIGRLPYTLYIGESKTVLDAKNSDRGPWSENARGIIMYEVKTLGWQSGWISSALEEIQDDFGPLADADEISMDVLEDENLDLVVLEDENLDLVDVAEILSDTAEVA